MNKRYVLMSCFESEMNLIGVFQNKDDATSELKRCLLEDLSDYGCTYVEGVLRGDSYNVAEDFAWGFFYDNFDNCYQYEVFEV